MNTKEKKEEVLAKLFILLAITSFLPALILYAFGFNTLDPERTPDLKGTALHVSLTLPLFAYTIYFAYKNIEEVKNLTRCLIEKVNINKFILAATFYIFLTVASHNGVKLISSEDIGIAVFYAFYLLPWTFTVFVKGLALIALTFKDTVCADTPHENQKIARDNRLKELEDEKSKEAINKIKEKIKKNQPPRKTKERLVEKKIILRTVDSEKINTHNNKL
ncbi:hypothetical protein [Pseudomonas amygdali]|uniref:hypothetical protein n=1 Tax=Pseudomonas amygdali TaxID=47877 RepID=UPI000710D76B|nr:hypothetical protein [Pseudomonas amygdali]KWS79709.1 hypothetical protein AL052_25350 [Pseudomonas amygdali pv. eriobotryae]